MKTLTLKGKKKQKLKKHHSQPHLVAKYASAPGTEERADPDNARQGKDDTHELKRTIQFSERPPSVARKVFRGPGPH